MAKGGITVDFTGVTSGGGRARLPEGDYLATVKNVKQDTSKSGNEMLIWEFEVKGKPFKSYTTLNTEALWKLKQLLEAMGMKVPDGRASLNLRNYLNKEVGVTLVDEEYNNKIHSTISDFISADMLDDSEPEEADDDEDEDDEEEETPAPKAKAKRTKKAKKTAPPPDDDDDEDEIEDIDLDEI